MLHFLRSLREIIAQQKCEFVYIAYDDSEVHLLNRTITLLSTLPVRLFLPADHYQMLLGDVKPLGVRGHPMIEIRRDLLTPIEAILKRLFDVSVSFFLLVLTLPLWALVAFLIVVDSKGPVFFAQTRVGIRGEKFLMLKFRSMIPDAELKTGPILVTKGDARITRIGKYLRSTRIDELPQLLNVLIGQMSLVGPRPERPEFIEEFARTSPLFKRRLNIKPGLTGWAQVHLQYDATIVAPEKKLEMDLYYIENMSLPLDVKILFMTMFVVLRGEG
ncbi:MAG: sugar transferase [bacterium]|nr:sugar transferase [bacterium]